MGKVASLEELKDFANKVRKAGGGNPLDALMPAIPEDAEQCLIAKNLNFNCVVTSSQVEIPNTAEETYWCMRLDDIKIRDKIAEALNLKKIGGNEYEDPGVLLPAAIGRVAGEFDEWCSALTKEEYDEEKEEWVFKIHENATPEEIKRLRKFGPYIDEGIKEAYENGVFNKKGELIL